jgi:hypothetical protein
MFSRSDLRKRVEAVVATVRAEFPAVRDQACDLVRAAGRKAREHAPSLVADLVDGKLPEIEAVVLAAARRVAPGIGTAASVAATVARRRQKDRPSG